MKLRWSERAMQTLARELRRASWGAALIFSGAGIKSDLGIGYVLGAAVWVSLQLVSPGSDLLALPCGRPCSAIS